MPDSFSAELELSVDEPLPKIRSKPLTGRKCDLSSTLVVKAWIVSVAGHLAVFGAFVYFHDVDSSVDIAARSGPLSLESTASQASEGDLVEEVLLQDPLPKSQPSVETERAPIEAESMETTMLPATEPLEVLENSLPIAAPILPPDSDFLKDLAKPQPNESANSAASADSFSRSGNEEKTPPRFLSNPPIQYPPRAASSRIQGRVILRLRIDSTGLVIDVVLVKSSGHAVLDRAAMDGVRSWRAEPARLLGTPVATTVFLPIDFRLD